MMGFQVTSSWCIDKIPEVAKTKVLKRKKYSLSKLRLCHALLNGSFKHTPTCLHHNVGRFAKHCSNVYAKTEGGTIILAVVLLPPPEPCPGDAVFRCVSCTTYIYSGAKKYLVSHQLCKFSHLR